MDWKKKILDKIEEIRGEGGVLEELFTGRVFFKKIGNTSKRRIIEMRTTKKT